jgi:hypothetical protein
MFDFSAWLQSAAILAAALLPITVAITQGAGKLGLSGKAQTAFAIGTGLLLGVSSQVAIHGTPADFRGWFLAVIFGLILAGGSIGAYEAVKGAAIKAVNGE